MATYSDQTPTTGSIMASDDELSERAEIIYNDNLALIAENRRLRAREHQLMVALHKVEGIAHEMEAMFLGHEGYWDMPAYQWSQELLAAVHEGEDDRKDTYNGD